MGKHKNLIKRNADEFLASNQEALASGQPVVMSRLRAVIDDVCALCKAVSVDYGGTVKLKRCGQCALEYYCSRECQKQHWPVHKALCKEKKEQVNFVNSSVMSVPQMMILGERIFADETGVPLGKIKNSLIQPAPELSWPKTAISVLRVKVSTADRSGTVEVNALFSIAAEASSISERLAERLGLAKNGTIFVAGFRQFDCEAQLPSRSVDVECLDVVCDAEHRVLPQSSRMALLIVPNPGNEMVLGKDWLDDIVAQSGRHLLLDHAPDKMRIRVLPEGVKGRRIDIAHHARDNLDQGEFIAVRWGRADPGPSYSEDPNVCDMSHQVRPENSGRAKLARIAATL